MCHAAPAGKAHRLGKTQITLKKASRKDNSVRHIRETGRIHDHSFPKPTKRGPCLWVPSFLEYGVHVRGVQFRLDD